MHISIACGKATASEPQTGFSERVNVHSGDGQEGKSPFLAGTDVWPRRGAISYSSNGLIGLWCLKGEVLRPVTTLDRNPR